jgi:integrase
MSSEMQSRRHDATTIKIARELIAGEQVLATRGPVPLQFETSSLAATLHDNELSSNARARALSETLNPLTARYNPIIQDSRMSFALFVEGKFIPEHVEHKTLSGQTHYQSMLKHLLRPETVNRMFNPRGIVNGRLKNVPGWPYLDELRLCDITSDHVRRLIAAASACGYSAQTVKHIKNVFFAIISYAQREGCFAGPNPVSQVRLPPVTRKTRHNVTISQTTAILELMQYPDREIALFSLTTGMNIVEICELQWKHVNLRNSEMYLDGELIPPRCLAVRARWNLSGIGDTNHARNRNIEIPERLLSHFRELSRRRANPNRNDFVLVSETGGPIPPESIRAERLKPIGKKLGIPWLSWQVLRRAHVSLLAEYRAQLAAQMMRRLSKPDCDWSRNCHSVEWIGQEGLT